MQPGKVESKQPPWDIPIPLVPLLTDQAGLQKTLQTPFPPALPSNGQWNTVGTGFIQNFIHVARTK